MKNLLIRISGLFLYSYRIKVWLFYNHSFNSKVNIIVIVSGTNEKTAVTASLCIQIRLSFLEYYYAKCPSTTFTVI